MSVNKIAPSLRPPTKQCSAMSKRTGLRCRARIPVWESVCRMHGGNSPQARAVAAARRLSWLAAQRDDPVVSRDPGEALLAAAAEADAMAQRLKAQLDAGVLDAVSVAAVT